MPVKRFQTSSLHFLSLFSSVISTGLFGEPHPLFPVTREGYAHAKQVILDGKVRLGCGWGPSNLTNPEWFSFETRLTENKPSVLCLYRVGGEGSVLLVLLQGQEEKAHRASN